MSALSLALVISFAAQGQFNKELQQQEQLFERLWNEELISKFDELPTSSKIPGYRLPYSGHDYPDKRGGTARVCWKYDQAFNNRQPLAYQRERWELASHAQVRETKMITVNVGMGRRSYQEQRPVEVVPGWYGHCNGYTAAAIRHAHPQKSVVRNGIEFTPADIKGLLAEIYLHGSSEYLAGRDSPINPAMFHIVVANWLGRKHHPLGLEAAPGKMVVNFPMHTFRTKVQRLSARQVAVQMWVRFSMNTPHEYERDVDWNRWGYVHYNLDLDRDGNIVGGQYHNDSSKFDLLWVPLQPTQGGTKKNKYGSPHINVEEVLSMWRESVKEEVHGKWVNIDPTEFEQEMIAKMSAPPQDPPTVEPPAENPASATPKPATESPTAETPTAETPAAETPAAETPAAETPAAESPTAESPVSTPTTEDRPAAPEPAPDSDVPAAPVPVVDETSGDSE